MSAAAELCPAHRYDDKAKPPPERVICIHEEPPQGAWAFVCWSCWNAMLNRRARRMEWEVD